MLVRRDRLVHPLARIPLEIEVQRRRAGGVLDRGYHTTGGGMIMWTFRVVIAKLRQTWGQTSCAATASQNAVVEALPP
jgi:hypothetical protein